MLLSQFHMNYGYFDIFNEYAFLIKGMIRGHCALNGWDLCPEASSLEIQMNINDANVEQCGDGKLVARYQLLPTNLSNLLNTIFDGKIIIFSIIMA